MRLKRNSWGGSESQKFREGAERTVLFLRIVVSVGGDFSAAAASLNVIAYLGRRWW